MEIPEEYDEIIKKLKGVVHILQLLSQAFAFGKPNDVDWKM